MHLLVVNISLVYLFVALTSILMLAYLVTKGQGVPLAGRGPNGALSRAQRRHLRRAGLSAEEIAAVVAPALAATPAAAPGPPLVGPAPAPASGEAMDAETGGVSAPDEHQRQEEGGGWGGGEGKEEFWWGGDSDFFFVFCCLLLLFFFSFFFRDYIIHFFSEEYCVLCEIMLPPKYLLRICLVLQKKRLWYWKLGDNCGLYRIPMLICTSTKVYDNNPYSL